MSETKRKVPKLRFPGFTEDWEQRKLGELYERVNERNDGTLGRDKWISVAKMYFQNPDKVQSNNLDTRTYVMQRGDIAFEGHPNNEFKFGRFVLNDIGTGIISELFPIYRPIVRYDLNFWKYAIQLERTMAPIFAKSITSSGNSSNKLDQNHFLQQSITIPTVEEQKVIGSFLENISNLITLHQRKLENLKLKKKALLQKMFPKNGEQFPELRFPGFTDAWEQRKLGECSVIITGGTPGTRILEYWSPKEIPWMSSGEINKKRISKTDDKISKLGLEQSSARWVKKNSILIALAGQGKTRGTVAINEIDLTTNQSIAAIELDSVFNTEFVFQNLDSRYDELRKESSGDGTRGGLNKKIISDLYIPYTEYKEQDIIGDFFKKLDNLITLHQRKLEHLQLQKKALLQQMFV